MKLLDKKKREFNISLHNLFIFFGEAIFYLLNIALQIS